MTRSKQLVSLVTGLCALPLVALVQSCLHPEPAARPDVSVVYADLRSLSAQPPVPVQASGTLSLDALLRLHPNTVAAPPLRPLVPHQASFTVPVAVVQRATATLDALEMEVAEVRPNAALGTLLDNAASLDLASLMWDCVVRQEKPPVALVLSSRAYPSLFAWLLRLLRVCRPKVRFVVRRAATPGSVYVRVLMVSGFRCMRHRV